MYKILCGVNIYHIMTSINDLQEGHKHYFLKQMLNNTKKFTKDSIQKIHDNLYKLHAYALQPPKTRVEFLDSILLWLKDTDRNAQNETDSQDFSDKYDMAMKYLNAKTSNTRNTETQGIISNFENYVDRI
jgi:hypothetical protein